MRLKSVTLLLLSLAGFAGAESYHMDGKDLKISSGSLAAHFDGTSIRTSYGEFLGYINSNSIYDKNRNLLAVCRDERILDDREMTSLGTMNDAKREISNGESGVLLAAMWLLALRKATAPSAPSPSVHQSSSFSSSGSSSSPGASGKKVTGRQSAATGQTVEEARPEEYPASEEVAPEDPPLTAEDEDAEKEDPRIKLLKDAADILFK